MLLYLALKNPHSLATKFWTDLNSQNPEFTELTNIKIHEVMKRKPTDQRVEQSFRKVAVKKLSYFELPETI